jgi:hypothetical protein
LRAIDPPIMTAHYKVIVLLGAEEITDVRTVLEEIVPEIQEPPDMSSIFSVNSSACPSGTTGGGGLLPPASLPEIGSFLFPSPMLPMDLVKAAVEMMLTLGVMQIPSTGDFVLKGMPFGIPFGEDAGEAAAYLFQELVNLTVKCDPPDPNAPNPKSVVDWEPGYGPGNVDATVEAMEKILLQAMPVLTEERPNALFLKVKDKFAGLGPVLALPNVAKPIAITDTKMPIYMFDSRPDRIQKGNWVVAEFTEGLYATKIDCIATFIDDDKTEYFGLFFSDIPSQPGELKKVHADFRGKLLPQNATLNLSPISPDNFKLDHVPENLKVGRQVLITGCGDPYLTKIIAIDGDHITFNQPLSPCFLGKMVINGNVVLAGHGERMPEKILGSGDAAQSNQSFIFGVEGVSFIADETKSAGVAADIDVIVDRQIWDQVSSLNDSGPTDIHYSVHMTEEGFLKINFGDGEHGRRLPSGSNNVRIAYRKGSGLAGNIPASGLEKVVKPHRLVESVLQPMETTGGNDMEDVTSLRENAPASLLTLDRAVSLADFENLAASDSRVWQAKAFSRASVLNRHENVEVVIVPAGGGELGDLASNIKKSLQSKALPGVIVTVSKYSEIPLDLDVTIKVKDDEYNPEMVIDEVKSALLDAFSLSRSRLGEHLYLSRVYQVVENVEGVERSICIIDDNSDLRVKKANSDHLIYLAVDEFPPNVVHKAYAL